jgi:hypothetical protein
MSKATGPSAKSTAKASNAGKRVGALPSDLAASPIGATPGARVDTSASQVKGRKRKGKSRGSGDGQNAATDAEQDRSKLEDPIQKTESFQQAVGVKQYDYEASVVTHEQSSGDIRVAPQTGKSWANVCSSEPVVCKLSLPLLHEDIVSKTALSSQTPLTPVYFQVMLPLSSGDHLATLPLLSLLLLKDQHRGTCHYHLQGLSRHPLCHTPRSCSRLQPI